MRRWFVSYNSQDLALVLTFEAALRRKDPGAHIFFAPKSLRAGSMWLPELASEIWEASAFILLISENGVGSWQVTEYYEAIDRHVKDPTFQVIPVILEGQTAPGLPFLRQLNWIITADPASDESLAKLMDAAAGKRTQVGELWRHTAPYRGLAAMTEADSDFFFGRERETSEVLVTLATRPDRAPVLLGNSGVGKTSLAQAGVLAALKRQTWPERLGEVTALPHVFKDTRRWCFLTLEPGVEPVKALVETILDTWKFDTGDSARIKGRNDWVELLLDDNKSTSLADLLGETRRRYHELNRPEPPAFLLYVDQAEELYVRAGERQRRRFSELITQALSSLSLRVLMSLRADFFGDLQKDELLFRVHQLINVPPLDERQLFAVVNRPAELLFARFETNRLAADIAHRAADESTRDAGALPLLSYLLDDMWTAMVKRGDGVLRLPAAAFELGGVLAERANTFLFNHPRSEETLRRILTLKLATVREDGEPSRRRAPRAEFTNAEWHLVSEMADYPNRLIVTATGEDGETFALIAHEAIFRRWDRLRDWIAAERRFLAWRNAAEATLHQWHARGRDKGFLIPAGAPLAEAEGMALAHPRELAPGLLNFIHLSGRRVRLRQYILVGFTVIFGFTAILAGFNYIQLNKRQDALKQSISKTKVFLSNLIERLSLDEIDREDLLGTIYIQAEDLKRFMETTSIPLEDENDSTGDIFAEAASFRVNQVIRLYDLHMDELEWPAAGELRTSFTTTGSQQNDGINITVPSGTKIGSIHDGIVAYAGDALKGYGNLILIRHPNKLISAYAHLDRILVRKLETVHKGQTIGLAGATGSVDGPQLHLEIRIGRYPINPLLLLPIRAGDEWALAGLKDYTDAALNAYNPDAAFRIAERVASAIRNNSEEFSDLAKFDWIIDSIWYALLAKRFDGALHEAEMARPVIANQDIELLLESTRAHALMFLGRIDEARTIYVSNRGKKLLKMTWDDILRRHFAIFRDRELDVPLMNEIEQALSRPPD